LLHSRKASIKRSPRAPEKCYTHPFRASFNQSQLLPDDWGILD
jgi:hypothetical protein